MFHLDNLTPWLASLIRNWKKELEFPTELEKRIALSNGPLADGVLSGMESQRCHSLVCPTWVYLFEYKVQREEVTWATE